MLVALYFNMVSVGLKQMHKMNYAQVMFLFFSLSLIFQWPYKMAILIALKIKSWLHRNNFLQVQD